jgi:hypothetical protein
MPHLNTTNTLRHVPGQRLAALDARDHAQVSGTCVSKRRTQRPAGPITSSHQSHPATTIAPVAMTVAWRPGQFQPQWRHGNRFFVATPRLRPARTLHIGTSNSCESWGVVNGRLRARRMRRSPALRHACAMCLSARVRPRRTPRTSLSDCQTERHTTVAFRPRPSTTAVTGSCVMPSYQCHRQARHMTTTNARPATTPRPATGAAGGSQVGTCLPPTTAWRSVPTVAGKNARTWLRQQLPAHDLCLATRQLPQRHIRQLFQLSQRHQCDRQDAHAHALHQRL